MWLVNTRTLDLENFQECPVDKYAVLSHTWGPASEEVTFDEYVRGTGRQKSGYIKIQKCCEQAQRDDLSYAWIDTCCIDKRSSTELSEAINSMFSWYAAARICYVYLADVPYDNTMELLCCSTAFHQSRWFTRGWTLQELIAPKTVSFYTSDWLWIGDRLGLAEHLETITGINRYVLMAEKDHLDCSIAERMSWASKRQTTRLEDTAYCLIGLLDAKMPLLYGEGAQAFVRLQEEILRTTDDESIFAWTGVATQGSGLLAPSPAYFAGATSLIRGRQINDRHPYLKTNKGLSIRCRMLPCDMNTYVVPLNCYKPQPNSCTKQVALYICRTLNDRQYRRVQFGGKCLDEADNWDMSKAKTEDILVPDDARMLQLAPHAGLPVIYMRSNLEIYNFSRPQQGSQGPRPVGPVISDDRDLEKESIESVQPGTSSSPYIPWKPIKMDSASCKYQFQIQDLEHGFVIALKRPSDDRFYCHVEIGFDMDFRPICILHAASFRLDKASFRFHKVIMEFLGKLGRLPVHERIWSRNTRDSEGDERSIDIPRSRARWGRDSPSWPPKIRRYSCFDHREYLSTVRGDQKSGIRHSTNDLLPSEHGCVDLKLEFHHLHGLDWQLTIREEHQHTEMPRSRGSCHSVHLNSIFRVIYGLATTTWSLVWSWCVTLGGALIIFAAYMWVLQEIFPGLNLAQIFSLYCVLVIMPKLDIVSMKQYAKTQEPCCSTTPDRPFKHSLEKREPENEGAVTISKNLTDCFYERLLDDEMPALSIDGSTTKAREDYEGRLVQ